MAAGITFVLSSLLISCVSTGIIHATILHDSSTELISKMPSNEKSNDERSNEMKIMQV